MRLTIILAAAAILSGCAAPQPDTDPMVFGRIDCKRGSASQDVQTQYELDKQVCLGRASAAGLSGTAAMPTYGLAGAINQSVTASGISNATAVSCMAERNYLWARRSQHEQRCAGVDPIKGRQLTTSR